MPHKKKWLVPITSSILIEAETAYDAEEEVLGILEEVKKRNQGGIEDEILANATLPSQGSRTTEQIDEK